MPVLPEYDLTGKTAILSTSGGGEAPYLAQALTEAGASVFAVARTQALLDAVLASLPSGSSGAVMDASVPDSAKSVMEQFDRSHKTVDILVNDPRSIYAKPLEDIGSDEWDEVQTRNAKAPFLLSQQVAPHGQGRVRPGGQHDLGISREGHDQRLGFRRQSGRRFGANPFTGRGMEPLQHPDQRHRDRADRY